MSAQLTDRELLEFAAKAVRYENSTGKIFWLPKSAGDKDAMRWNSRYSGKECGTLDDKGYRRILVRAHGKILRIRSHQLAWFIAHGSMPKGEIDHINQDKLDNRMDNLRDVDRATNQRNGTRKSNNTSGIPGVTWHKQRAKWCAQASINGKHHHLGLYLDPREAEYAVKKFRAANGFTETHGRAIVPAAAKIGKAMP